MANGCLQLRGQLVEGKDLGMMSALAKEISTTKVKVRVLGEECLDLAIQDSPGASSRDTAGHIQNDSLV